MMAGFIFLVKKVLLARLDDIEHNSSRLFEMQSTDPPERKAAILAENEDSLDKYPREYEPLFVEFNKMCSYIIRSDVNFVKKERIVAYSPNKFSKELLKDEAQEVTIYPPPLLDD